MPQYKYHTDGSIMVNGMPGGSVGPSFKQILKSRANTAKRGAARVGGALKKVGLSAARELKEQLKGSSSIHMTGTYPPPDKKK